MNTNIRDRFKKINPIEEEKRQAAEIAANNIKRLSLTNDKIPTLDVTKAGPKWVRLLPQPIDSEDSFSHMLAYVYVKETDIPMHKGYLALTHKQAEFLRTISSMFFSSDDFRDLLKTKANPTGISLFPKYRELFLGFLPKDPEKKLYLVVLPSNGFTPNPSQIQAGTQIKQFPFEKTLSGELKYGNIFDIENGSLIKIETSGESDRTSYKPSVDEKFPLMSEEYDEVLSQVVPFSDLIVYATPKQFLTYLRTNLTAAMFDYMVEQMHLEEKMRGKVISNEDWEEILSCPSKRIGYTQKPAARSQQYNTQRYTPAPKFQHKVEQDEDDEEDEIPMGDETPTAPKANMAPAPKTGVASKVESAAASSGSDVKADTGVVTATQQAIRQTIENLRKNGLSDASIPPQLFVEAGWEPNLTDK